MASSFRKINAILIFGGTGFLGSNFVKYLLRQNIKVLVYKNKSLGYLANIKSDNLNIIDTYDKSIRDIYS